MLLIKTKATQHRMQAMPLRAAPDAHQLARQRVNMVFR
jgi:hypothetical protein